MMDEHVIPIIAANETVTFGFVEPLYRSLFCHVIGRFPFFYFYAGEIRRTEGQVLAAAARATQDRLDLTYAAMVRGEQWQFQGGRGPCAC